MSADILVLPRGFDVPVEFRAIIVGARTGCPVSHARLGIRGRTTGNARRYRQRLWLQVAVDGVAQFWWAAHNIVRDDGHNTPILDGSIA